MSFTYQIEPGVAINVPAFLGDRPTRFVTIDRSGGICAWTTKEEPSTHESGVWMGGTEDGVNEVLEIGHACPDGSRFDAWRESFAVVGVSV